MWVHLDRIITLGRELRIRYLDMPEKLTAQHQKFMQADLFKLIAARHASFATPLERGVR